jgi:hypothetical protein
MTAPSPHAGRLLRMLPLGVAIAIGAAGCGGSGGNRPAATATTPTSPATEAAAIKARLQKAGYSIVPENYPPRSSPQPVQSFKI